MRLAESLLSRRGFFSGLIGGALASVGAFIAYPFTRFLFHKKSEPLPSAVTVALADIEKMPPNTAAYFTYGSLPGVVLKTAEGELRAFSARCTHLDCTVQYRPEERKFFCACHDGYFDDKGVNIAGPPPRPLPTFSMQTEGRSLVLRYEEDEKKKHGIS